MVAVVVDDDDDETRAYQETWKNSNDKANSNGITIRLVDHRFCSADCGRCRVRLVDAIPDFGWSPINEDDEAAAAALCALRRFIDL